LANRKPQRGPAANPIKRNKIARQGHGWRYPFKTHPVNRLIKVGVPGLF
jgi:hypothetical protein